MSAAGSTAARTTAPDFVRAARGQLWLGGCPYRFVGVNLWYGAYLGVAAEFGDRDRLRAELDHLARLGLCNVRVMGGTEASPMQNSVRPSFRGAGPDYNEVLLRGLDLLLAELRARDLRAVLCLTNFWEWSGGMGTYLCWVNDGRYVDMDDPAHPWPAFPEATMRFYGSAPANALYRDYVRALVTRTNSVTGLAYRDDPTVMAWQLANEPRAGSRLVPGHHVVPEFVRWVHETAAFVKALAPRQLVSTGSEGLVGCVGDERCLLDAHASPDVDYLTCHIWPKNWGWLVAEEMERTYADAEQRSLAYLARHATAAEQLGKPLVLEEFGFPRDGGALAPDTSTRFRDRYFDALLSHALARGALAGANVWTWGGRGRAEHADARWRAADRSYTGDPPQEPQGLNSVFDSDASTLQVLAEHASVLEPQCSDAEAPAPDRASPAPSPTDTTPSNEREQ